LSYQTLPQYLDAIKNSNPGIITYYKVDPYSFNMVRFCHIFCAFGPLIEGFSYCRPLFSIDGTHLYEK